MARLLHLLLVALLSFMINALHAKKDASAVTAQAIYVMDNNDKNAIHAIRVNPNGTLANNVTVISTLGKGSSGQAGGTSPPTNAGPDALFSSGSVTVAGNFLFTVNAGSNTLVGYFIKPEDPLHPVPLSIPQPSFGDFPNSVAVSLKHNLTCVTNTGNQSSVGCFRLFQSAGQTGLEGISFYPYPLGQTTPPVGFGNLPLNVQDGPLLTSAAFNADESALIVTQSGNPATYTDGHLLIYQVLNSTNDLSGAPFVFTTARAPVLHSTINIPNTNKVFATDATFGTAIFDINVSEQSVVTDSVTVVPDERHIGWSFLSPTTGTVFSTDALVNRLVEQNATTGAIIGYIRGTNGASGMTDISGSGDKLYALSQGTRPNSSWVTVFDVSGGPGKGKVLQNFRLQGFSNRSTRGTYAAAVGMAVFPNA